MPRPAKPAARRADRRGPGPPRLSSPELEGPLAEELAARGLEVPRVGRGPSPMPYFATHHLPD